MSNLYEEKVIIYDFLEDETPQDRECNLDDAIKDIAKVILDSNTKSFHLEKCELLDKMIRIDGWYSSYPLAYLITYSFTSNAMRDIAWKESGLASFMESRKGGAV